MRLKCAVLDSVSWESGKRNASSEHNGNKDTVTGSEWRGEIKRVTQLDSEVSVYLQANFAQPVL